MNIRRAIPILLILAAPAAMLYPLWSHPTSANEDDLIFYYPLRKMVGQALARGEWPMNNPLEATGGPLLSDPQAAGLHPTTWLFAVVPPKPAYSLSIFAAFSMAGLGALFYLRRLGLVEAAATFGAVVFMFSGFFVGHRVHLSMIQTAGMLPWILLAIELSRAKGNGAARPGAAFAVLTGALFLAIAGGSWPTLIQMGIVCAAYFLLRARPLGRALAVCLPAVVLAAVMAGPQIIATAQLLGEATRQKIGFATAGENSFFPAAGVLAFFPMLMGQRWPNFFSQSWWGPWHQCEMLGYVGLVTLGLAGSTLWRMYRKRPRKPKASADAAVAAEADLRDANHVNLVRVWTWLMIGAGIWMLGYYIPPLFWLIHKVPILGVVRCPARMVLAVDLALATLSAMAVHGVVAGRADIGSTVRRFALIVLPVATLAMLAGAAAMAFKVSNSDFWRFFFPLGTQADAKAAFHASNPAIWVQLALLAITMAGVSFWLRSPRKLSVLMVGLVLLDLFFIARFVDMPADSVRQQDPDTSPAAGWLLANAPQGESYRVLAISDGYFGRAAELLRPKVCNSMGIASINSYGPFQNPRHAQLLSLSIYGTSRDWESLVRRNYLLSLYDVRYIVTADPAVRGVLESVTIPAHAPPADGANILTSQFDLHEVSSASGVMTFQTSAMWRPSEAIQAVRLEPGQVYRVSLNARAAQGAANFLQAEVCDIFKDGRPWEQTGLSIRAEELGPDWRHFEWTFTAPADLWENRTFRIRSISERPIEVKDVSLRPSHLDVPVNLKGKLQPGKAVYERRVVLPPLNASDTLVAIYENLLCGKAAIGPESDTAAIERLKWDFDAEASAKATVPDVSLKLSGSYISLLYAFTIPATAVYLFAIAVIVVVPRLRARRKLEDGSQ